ncbi:hypothetical protein PM082_000123 [Marasmius tenuissimus]|nr:hypothetical protein PM082_000123 [Marasmius tenuissimus]
MAIYALNGQLYIQGSEHLVDVLDQYLPNKLAIHRAYPRPLLNQTISGVRRNPDLITKRTNLQPGTS